MSEYSHPIYRFLCLDHFETPRNVPDLIGDSNVEDHRLLVEVELGRKALNVMPSMRLYLPCVEARLRGITALKAMSQVR